ncbi:MAG: class I SAM-dependent methyltransferase [Zetaproteobacteria bacterium]|nr:MAG: class I SAM-dependent methyltransferase [Zetaproteobacteria bacterium]
MGTCSEHSSEDARSPWLGAISMKSCPVCGGRSVAWVRVFDRQGIASGEWTLRRCEACGAGFLDPMPSLEETQGFYPETYYAYTPPTLPTPPKNPIKRWEWRWRTQRLAARLHALGYPVDPPAKAWRILARMFPPRSEIPPFREGVLLDVGCGSGAYLLQMKQWGWQVKGVEPNRQAARAAKAAGLDVFAGFLREANLPPESVAMVRMNDVLEHIPDPVEEMQEVARILEPRGIVEITTPNLDSWSFALFRGYWFPLETPRHLILFTPRALKKLADQVGLEIVELKIWSYKEVDVLPSIGAWLSDHAPRLAEVWNNTRWLQKGVRKLITPVKVLGDALGKGSAITVRMRKPA